MARRLSHRRCRRTCNCIISTAPWPGSARRSLRPIKPAARSLHARGMEGPRRGAAVARRRTLFSDLSVVIMDTTSFYFEGEGARPGERGHSKDYRSHLNQMIVGVIIDRERRPICSEMWPGNTADVTTLIPVMISAATHRRTGAAGSGLHPRCARARHQGGARGCHGRPDTM
jgi:hypothetical protein